MSRAGEVWNSFTDEERDAIAQACRAILRDRGAALVQAIARDARRYTSSGAINRAAAALDDLTEQPYPFLTEPPPAPAELPYVCDDCHQPVPSVTPRWDFDAHQLLWLGPQCYRARMGLAHQTEEAS